MTIPGQTLDLIKVPIVPLWQRSTFCVGKGWFTSAGNHNKHKDNVLNFYVISTAVVLTEIGSLSKADEMTATVNLDKNSWSLFGKSSVDVKLMIVIVVGEVLVNNGAKQGRKEKLSAFVLQMIWDCLRVLLLVVWRMLLCIAADSVLFWGLICRVWMDPCSNYVAFHSNCYNNNANHY